MYILHHAVENSCSLVDLLLNDCIITPSVNPAGLHTDAKTPYFFNSRLPCSSVLAAAAEIEVCIDKLLSRFSLLTAHCVRGSPVNGLDRLSANRFRALLAVCVLGWWRYASRPHTAGP